MEDKFKKLESGFTFDDLLLEPAYSEIAPTQVDTRTKLTSSIGIAIPIVSAPMDTVTEGELAIALALSGGIGITHKNLAIEAQRKEIDKVKRHVTGMIVDPITLDVAAKVSDALALKERYKFCGFPIVENGRLVGLITNRDLRFEENLDRPIKEVMTPRDKLATAPVSISTAEAKKILRARRIEKLLVVDEDGALAGLMTVRDIERSIEHPLATKDRFGRLRVGGAIGVGARELERADELIRYGCDLIAIDTAHGHSKGVLDSARAFKRKYPERALIAGNVATAAGARALVDVGVDIVKVGIGPGSICTTRIVAGVGVPQLSAIHNCARAVAGSGATIIADGGIKSSGDIVKAIGAGADSVMIGSLFAGVEESPGEKILYQGRVYKEYRGMGSIGAMKSGSADRYSQSSGLGGESIKLVPEGIEARVPYKGSLDFVTHQLVGGLRSGMGYLGVRDIQTLRRDARFVKISPAGLRESHVHDVTITKEAPNYSPRAFDR